MITYNLSCTHGHEFEGWFNDSASYDRQEAAGALMCPTCADPHIRKAIMAPAVKGSVTKAKGARTAEESKSVRQYVSDVRKFVEENADYVGPKFPEEARKIHYGESDKRHIYGESTLAEAKALLEEGIDIAPLPPDPADLH